MSSIKAAFEIVRATIFGGLPQLILKELSPSQENEIEDQKIRALSARYFVVYVFFILTIGVTLATMLPDTDKRMIPLALIWIASCIPAFHIMHKRTRDTFPAFVVILISLVFFGTVIIANTGRFPPGLIILPPISLYSFVMFTGKRQAVVIVGTFILAAMALIFSTQPQVPFASNLAPASGKTIAVFIGISMMLFAMLIRLIRVQQKVVTSFLKSQNAQLVSLSNARNDFIANVSHELRTPMNAILGAVDVLERSEDATLKSEMLNITRDAARGLLAQLEDVLDLAKLEANTLVLSPSPTNVQLFIRRTIALWENQLIDKRLKCDLDLPSETNENLELDQVRVQQILSTLIANAIKHTHIGGITIAVRRTEDVINSNYVKLEITVSDTGDGVAWRDRDQLFQPMASVSGSKQVQHSGLGLSLGRRLARAMKGDLRLLDRTPGAHFQLTLLAKKSTQTLGVSQAITPQNQENLGALQTSDGAPKKAHKRILCVDDHPANLRIVSLLLGELDFDLDVAMSGKEAIELCNSRPPYDAILMDIMMPEMNGIETTRHIQNLQSPNAHVPIIALTANVNPEQVSSYLTAGMQGVVAKPIESRLLIVEIERALRLQRAS